MGHLDEALALLAPLGDQDRATAIEAIISAREGARAETWRTAATALRGIGDDRTAASFDRQADSIEERLCRFTSKTEKAPFINIRDFVGPGEPPLAEIQSSRANKIACPACSMVNPIHLYANGMCSGCYRCERCRAAAVSCDWQKLPADLRSSDARYCAECFDWLCGPGYGAPDPDAEAVERGACPACWKAYLSGLRPCCSEHSPEDPRLGVDRP